MTVVTIHRRRVHQSIREFRDVRKVATTVWQRFVTATSRVSIRVCHGHNESPQKNEIAKRNRCAIGSKIHLHVLIRTPKVRLAIFRHTEHCRVEWNFQLENFFDFFFGTFRLPKHSYEMFSIDSYGAIYYWYYSNDSYHKSDREKPVNCWFLVFFFYRMKFVNCFHFYWLLWTFECVRLVEVSFLISVHVGIFPWELPKHPKPNVENNNNDCCQKRRIISRKKKKNKNHMHNVLICIVIFFSKPTNFDKHTRQT